MKTLPVAKWVMQRYALLWHKFKEKEFTYEEVSKLFNKDSDNLTRAALSQLRKNGWLTVELNSDDSRKRIYRLKSPIIAIGNMSD